MQRPRRRPAPASCAPHATTASQWGDTAAASETSRAAGPSDRTGLTRPSARVTRAAMSSLPALPAERANASTRSPRSPYASANRRDVSGRRDRRGRGKSASGRPQQRRAHRAATAQRLHPRDREIAARAAGERGLHVARGGAQASERVRTTQRAVCRRQRDADAGRCPVADRQTRSRGSGREQVGDPVATVPRRGGEHACFPDVPEGGAARLGPQDAREAIGRARERRDRVAVAGERQRGPRAGVDAVGDDGGAPQRGAATSPAQAASAAMLNPHNTTPRAGFMYRQRARVANGCAASPHPRTPAGHRRLGATFPSRWRVRTRPRRAGGAVRSRRNGLPVA